ncbi:MAG: tyrosine-type recombinase/integrase [Pseudomonadota bacterium]
MVAGGAISLSRNFVLNVKAEHRERFYADRRLKCFWLRVGAAPKVAGRTPSKSYVFRHRNRGGRLEKFTLGDAYTMPNDVARDLAIRAYQVQREGGDPRHVLGKTVQETTVGDLLDRYLGEWSAVRNKPRTHATNVSRVERCLRPQLGKKRLSALTRGEIERWKTAMRERPIDCNRSLAILKKSLRLARENWELIDHDPVSGIEPWPERQSDRIVSDAELRALIAALSELEAEAANPSALLAIRLCMLTGCRLGEIVGLRWSWVDIERCEFVFPDSKTGQKIIPVGPAAIELLQGVPLRDDNPHVCASDTRRGGPIAPGTVTRLLQKARARAAITGKGMLEGITTHAFRRTHATRAADDGASQWALMEAFGWKTGQMAQRYVKRAAASGRLLVNERSNYVAAMMERASDGS